MSPAASDLAVLIRFMGPELHPGVDAYCVVPKGSDVSALSPVATVAAVPRHPTFRIAGRSANHRCGIHGMASFVARGSNAASVRAAIQPKVMAGPSVMPPAG